MRALTLGSAGRSWVQFRTVRKEIEMKKSLQLRLAAIPAVVMASAGSAMAAVPADVTTALGDLKTDALSVATAVLLAIVAVYAFKFIRRGL